MYLKLCVYLIKFTRTAVVIVRSKRKKKKLETVAVLCELDEDVVRLGQVGWNEWRLYSPPPHPDELETKSIKGYKLLLCTPWRLLQWQAVLAFV